MTRAKAKKSVPVLDVRTIERVEKKYLITSQEKAKLLRAIDRHLKRDEFYKEKVMSIYFDTDNNDLVIKSIDRPNFREKVRARVYSATSGESPVFLEIKSKHAVKKKKISNKRRLVLTQSDFEEFMSGGKLETIAKRNYADNFKQMQIAKELAYIIDYLKLKPKIMIISDRIAFSSINGSGFRLTFDEKLRFRTDGLSFRKGSKGEKYFPNTDNPKKSIIMEVKTMNAMPPWFVKELSRLRIYPTRFSKYGKIYQLINERNQNNV